ncbi:ABC transporter permease [Halobellus salinus]|uniref:ABC transporter permease n=1 Tax=Halobellus salinus TaxID=931585 RepID=UPI001E642C17|nr:ABC transporter permease [Halobellus salinus]
MRARVRRVVAVLGLGVRRLLGKLSTRESTRLLFSVTGVAVAIMLMTTVSGVAVGLASQSAVQSENVDYWVVPEGGSVDTIAVSTDGPKLGDTHRLAAELSRDERVSYATPVLLQVVPVPSADGPQYVLFLGVVPPRNATPTIAGLPTARLTPGDPYYADGQYNGTWTGEVVVNPAAANILNVTSGSVVAPRGTDRNFSVVGVSDEQFTTGVGVTPVALVHLSELQQVTGATGGDAADQLLVSTNSPGVQQRLEGVYPNTVVVTRSGIATQQVSTSSLPAAMGVAALLISLVVGVLFTATMMGLEITNDRQTLGTLTALGYSSRSLAVLVAAETVTLAVVGGVVGVGLGAVGIVAVNRLATSVFGVESLAVFEPGLLVYGLGVALLIGLLATPYPIWLSHRTDPLAVIRR